MAINPAKVVVSSLLIIPAILLLAIGPRSDQNLPADRVVVDYWEKWTADEERQMREIVNQFNETVGKDKHIFVRYVSTSSVDQKTKVATAAGVPPDIAGMWDGQIAQFAELDALEPLDDLAAAATPKPIDQSTYKPVFWNACHYKGHLYALVSTPAAIALHYNKKVFAENADQLRAAGLDPTRPPKTIDELDAYAKVLDKFDAAGHLDRAGYLPMEPGWYINYNHFWFGASIWDAKNQKFTLTDPAVVKTYNWIQSYSKRLGENATSEFQSSEGNFDSPQNAFLCNRVAMEQQGPWMANYILNLAPKMDGLTAANQDDFNTSVKERTARMDWAAAPFPSAVPGLDNVTYCPFDTLIIPRGAKHKKEAFEFMAYVTRQDVMEKLCKMHSKNSPLAAVSEDFLEHHKNPYIKVFETLASSPNARGVPQIPIWPEVDEEITNMTQRIVLLRAEPAEALKDCQDRLQQKYDAFMENSDPGEILLDRVRHPATITVDTSENQSMQSPNSERSNLIKGMAFLSPWLVGFIIFTVIPIGMSARFSFCDYTLLQPPLYRGTENYRTLWGDPVFWKALRVTFYYALVALPLGMLIALALALLLNTKIRGLSIYRTMIFLPSLVPAVASAMLWLWLFNSQLGLINIALRKLGIANPPGWLAVPEWTMPALILMSFWGVGNTVIIYLAGLQDVPAELYEAADLDGANGWQKIVNVTLPSISPVIFFNLVMAIIGSMQSFTQFNIMAPNGGLDRAALVYTVHLYDTAFVHLKMGEASAMAWIQLFIVLTLTALAFWSSKKWVHYQGK